MNIDKKKYFDELREFEDRYYYLISHFNVNFPKAFNLLEEKKKFFRAIADDNFYNPKLKFEKKRFDEEKIKELKQLKISTRGDIYGFKKLYKERLKSKIYEIECHKNWGKPISTKYVIKYRGKPSRYLLSKAKNYCKNYKREIVKFDVLDKRKVASELKKEVLRLTKQKVKVKYDKTLASKVNILPHSNLIKINPTVRLTSLDLKRLKVHEIGVHYMRYFNAKKFNIRILESGTSNYIETEEGLAVYSEHLKGVSSKAQMFIYAGRVIGTFYAQRLSFYEVYRILRNYNFKREDAFSITLRAKRNISDTSLKGGFTKDYVYFSGYLKVKKFAQNNNIDDLFIGKIKIEDLKTLRKIIKRFKQYDCI